MDTNGRSVYVRTSDERRRQLWLRVFGVDVLPVIGDAARVQEIRGQSLPAYDLHLRALHPGQRARLAAHISRKYGRGYADVRTELDTATSWPLIDNGDLETVQQPAPSLFDRVMTLMGTAVDHAKKATKNLQTS